MSYVQEQQIPVNQNWFHFQMLESVSHQYLSHEKLFCCFQSCFWLAENAQRLLFLLVIAQEDQMCSRIALCYWGHSNDWKWRNHLHRNELFYRPWSPQMMGVWCSFLESECWICLWTNLHGETLCHFCNCSLNIADIHKGFVLISSWVAWTTAAWWRKRHFFLRQDFFEFVILIKPNYYNIIYYKYNY